MANRGSFGFNLGLVVLALIAVETFVFGAVIDRTIGSLSTLRIPGFGQGEHQGKFRAAILRSQAAAKLNAQPADYYEIARHWEDVLTHDEVETRVIGDDELATLPHSAADVLVLPAAACLGEPQRKAILSWIGAGRGLVASGALGVRDANCAWKGWEFLESVTGLEDATSGTPEEDAYVAFRGDSFYSAGMPAGSAIDLPRQEMVWGKSSSPHGYWSDRRLRPAHPSGEMNAGSLAVDHRRGAARIVWFGFSEMVAGARSQSRDQLDHYQSSAVRWVGKQSLAFLGSWPGQAQAAAIVAEEIVDEAQQGEPLAKVAARLKVPITFVMSADAYRKNPAAAMRLEAAGELATSGDTAEPFAGSSLASLAGRLQRARAAWPSLGFAPPQRSASPLAWQAAQAARFGYYLDSDAPAGSTPSIAEMPDSTWLGIRKSYIARIPNLGTDDFEVLASYRGRNPNAAAAAQGFDRDLELNLYLGGVFTANLRSDLFGRAESSEASGALLRKLKSGPLWTTTAQELANWWIRRDRVRVQSRLISERRIRLAMSNRGRDELRDASVYVQLPFRPASIRLIPVVIGKELPRAVLVPGKDQLRLDFGRLRPESSQVILIALNES
jgi:hypothetical protein